MPEFILNTDSAPETWQALDDFARGFIEAAFFSDSSCFPASDFFTPEAQERVAEGQADGSIPSDSSVADINPESYTEIAETCAAFQKLAAELLAQAYSRGYDESQAGRDFYFTKAGHGVGYWSRDALEAGGLGDKLSELCRGGEINLDAEQNGDAPGGFWIHFYIG